MAETFGLKIGLEGEKEFKSQLAEINQTFKVLGSEMKLVDSEFEKNDNSMQAVSARSEVLKKTIEEQKKKVDTLRQALQNASTSFGENDKRTKNWQTQLNNAQAELNSLNKKLDETTDSLDDTSNEMDETKKSAKQMGEEIDDAGDSASDSSSKFEALGTICKTVAATMAAAFAAITAASVAAGKALVSMTKEGATFADNVLTASTVTGISTEKLQEYMYAAELVDVSVDTLTGSMKKNISAMKSAADGSSTYVEAYEQLGVQVTDVEGNLRDSEMVYWELIEALGRVENETERDALAMTILGKSAQELNPLIEAGSYKMQELGEQAKEAGYVLSDDLLNSYGALDDQIQYLNNGTTALKNALGTILLPVLTDLATDGVSLLSEFTKGIQNSNGDISKMEEVISEVLPKFLNSIMKYLPEIMDIALSIVRALASTIMNNLDLIIDTGAEIISSLFQGVLDAIPKIAEGAVKIITILINGLVSNLPKIVEAGIVLITTLGDGIAKALPTLIPSIVKVVTQLVKTLTNNLPKVIKMGLNIIKALAEGIMNAIPELIKALPDIIKGIVSFILDSIPEIINLGVELLTSLVEDLPTIIEEIVKAIPDIIDGLVTTIIDSIPAIIEAGVNLLVSLIENLPEIIEQIINAIPQIISSIVNALVGNIDKIIEAGIQLFTSLVTNLPQIISEIIKAIPQILSAIVNGFAQGVDQMKDIGRNLVKGLWEGIQSLSSWITNKVTSWAGDLWSGIKNVFGIHSPSKKMAWAGNMLMEGMALGIDQSADKAVSAADNATDRLNDAFNSLDSDASLNVDAHVNQIDKDSILSSLNDAYLTIKGSIKDGLGGLNSVSEQTQKLEIYVPVYLDGEEITNVTSKVQSGRTQSYRRAMGV